jgi:tRNA U34 5-carboxymethylaminomethyl modifying GTPase MnmE/TrmE
MNHARTTTWLPDEAQRFIDRLRFGASEQDTDAQETNSRIAVVGLPDVGKKTLCNSLWGWHAVSGSHSAIRHYGLFVLVDLPAEMQDADNVLYPLERAELILYVLDAERGLQSADFQWIARLRTMNATLLIVVNKVDAINTERTTQIISVLQSKLARPVLTVSANDVQAVHAQFIPALLKACPSLAEPLASEIGDLRQRVVRQLILRSILSSFAISITNDGEVDATALLGVQMRLIRRIGTLYGLKDRGHFLQEMMLSASLRTTMQIMSRAAARLELRSTTLLPAISAMILTLVVGMIATAYYSGRFPTWFGLGSL